MRLFLFFIFTLSVSFSNAQDVENGLEKLDTTKVYNNKIVTVPKAKHEQYKIITLDRDTTYVDTSLTIKSDYKYNYLRKDIFGLQQFANEGQTYNKLYFDLNHNNAFPEFGFKGKHYGYLEVKDINYYSVATPLTELYFKTVMEQGQNVDALITVNTSERFNFSIAYKGLRSLGKYINQLSSTGNFRFTTSYFTLNKRYEINAHFTGQDLLNGENGGITSINDFESEDNSFKNRARLQVYLTDAKSFLKGKRVFIDHSFRINKKETINNLFVNHQFNLENKFYEFNQQTLLTQIGNDAPFQRFGNSYVTSKINDQTRYQRMYNKLGATYENKTLGEFQFFIEDFKYVYRYDKVLILEDAIIPNQISQRINAVGGQYIYQKNNWNGKFLYNKAISKQTFSTIDAILKYKFNDKNDFSFQYQNISQIPNHNFTLHQSSYVDYNWKNDFKNEKINNVSIIANTQWVIATAQISLLNDHLYFSNDNSTNLQLVSPKQYDKPINYISFKVSKEIKYHKFALDNTILYQNVSQDENILNVPQIVTRNTVYFTNYFFKKALFLQTGITLNYFTKYNANDYNPVIGEFFVQDQTKIGNFPVLDFFVNARIRQTRIFLKAEHFNSGFSASNYYSAPNTPYRDFMIRFGLVWNFFQ
ncbi:putative porin [Flavobacterium sp.]|uniref:putative porin n=1 Tax=Flavobacterium sp. TaxID=239 RepID=UPI0037509C35